MIKLIVEGVKPRKAFEEAGLAYEPGTKDYKRVTQKAQRVRDKKRKLETLAITEDLKRTQKSLKLQLDVTREANEKLDHTQKK